MVRRCPTSPCFCSNHVGFGYICANRASRIPKKSPNASGSRFSTQEFSPTEVPHSIRTGRNTSLRCSRLRMRPTPLIPGHGPHPTQSLDPDQTQTCSNHPPNRGVIKTYLLHAPRPRCKVFFIKGGVFSILNDKKWREYSQKKP